ncbi:MAG: YitT family protein [Candidatus Nanopelagicales bacterium]
MHESREPQPWWRRAAAARKGSRTIPRTRWTARSVWRPTPASLTSLVVGLWLFGTGDAFLLAADLGATPWTVLAQGVSVRTGLTIGITTFLVSVTVLLLWIPLRQRPGLGTVLNIVVISIAIEVMYTVLPRPELMAERLAYVLVGTATIGLGSGFYLTAGHGPGPRDGWMTGLHHRTGWPVGRIRLCIEVTVLTIGWLLGGTVGVGTAVFALLIGQSVAVGLALVRRIAPPRPPH